MKPHPLCATSGAYLLISGSEKNSNPLRVYGTEVMASRLSRAEVEGAWFNPRCITIRSRESNSWLYRLRCAAPSMYVRRIALNSAAPEVACVLCGVMVIIAAPTTSTTSK